MRAREAALGDIVEAIAHRSGLALVLQDPLDERIDVDLCSLPLSDALRDLLRERSFALQRTGQTSTSNESPTARPGTLWIFRKESVHSRAAPAVAADGIEAAVRDADEAIATLGADLSDDDANTRLDAVSALADVESDQAAAMLAATALHDADSSVRAEALYGLGAIDGDASNLVLRRALEDTDAEVRKAAINALEDIGGEASVQLLAVALNDKDASLRAAVVDALGEIGGVTATSLLQQASTDEQSAVREAAEEILAQPRHRPGSAE